MDKPRYDRLIRRGTGVSKLDYSMTHLGSECMSQDSVTINYDQLVNHKLAE